MNICKPNSAYFISILQLIDSTSLQKNLSCQTVLIKSNQNVKCESYKFLQIQICVNEYL
jgi:hypothetical protein